MAYSIDMKISIRMDLENEAEDDAAKATIKAFVAAQGGKCEWKTNENTEGQIQARATLLIPADSAGDAYGTFTAVEGNLDQLPRSGECVRSLKLAFTQEGLPDPE